MVRRESRIRSNHGESGGAGGGIRTRDPLFTRAARRWPDRRRDAICASFAQLALDRSAESGTRIGTAAAPLVRLRRAAVDWLGPRSRPAGTPETRGQGGP